MREEFRRAAFVGFDMGEAVADDAAIGLAQAGQSQRIGRRAVEDEKHLAGSLEQFPEPVAGFGGPSILPVGWFVAVVDLRQRRQRFRAYTGVVVAGQLLERYVGVDHG